MTTLKDEIQRIFMVNNWQPDTEQLNTISNSLLKEIRTGSIDIVRCREIIGEICPDAQFIAMEGIDNSDLDTLLLVAMKRTGA